MATPSLQYLQGKWVMYQSKKELTVIEFSGNRYTISYSCPTVFGFFHSLVYGSEVMGSLHIEKDFIKLTFDTLPGVMRTPITLLSRVGHFIFQVGWYRVWNIESDALTVSEWEVGMGDET